MLSDNDAGSVFIMYSLLFSFIFFHFLKKKRNFASGNSVVCRFWIDFHCRYLTLASSSAHAEPQARQPFVRGGWVGKEDDILKGVYLTLCSDL